MKIIDRIYTYAFAALFGLPMLASAADSDKAATAPSDDIVASVGDQAITFSQLNTMLNSSAIVGLSIPELGTPQRDQVRLTLLDKVISANLLYLDALEKGMDKDPDYQRDIRRFSDGMLALVYKRRHLTGQIDVTDEEVEAFFENNIMEGTEFTDDVRMAIAAKLRKQKLSEGGAATAMRARLREGVPVEINVTELDPGDDGVRDDDEVVARIDGEAIVWGEIKGSLMRPANSKPVEKRIAALDKIIDMRIMTMKGREAGLESDPAYLVPYNEFRKVRLINNHRARLNESFAPGEQEIRDYYEQNRDRIMLRERRRVQSVVLATREEAESVKEQIENGTLTMYQAASQYSILPGAKKTLGEIGWVSEKTGFPELDELTFMLGPDEIGGPVESPNGWHLVKVLDVEDAVHGNIADPRTQQTTRRMMIKERLRDYVVALRSSDDFPVKVYDDRLSYHMQKEIDWYKARSETGTRPPEELYEQIDKLRGVEKQ